jgi:hypothetical protein
MNQSAMPHIFQNQQYRCDNFPKKRLRYLPYAFILNLTILCCSHIKEKTMAQKKIFAGILVMALVFTMAVVGCCNGTPADTSGGTPGDTSSGAPDGGVDAALNGTWVYHTIEWKLNNGSYELSVSEDGESHQMYKGTYFTSGSNITFERTYIWGGIYHDYDLESRWYTKAQIMASPLAEAFSASELEALFTPFTGIYSVSGDCLTMTLTEGTETIYTKR